MLNKIISLFVQRLKTKSDILLAGFVIMIFMLLVIPVYPFVIDLLISVSITLAVTTLLVTLYAKEPLSFSSFPSLLLIFTLYRLGLNIATTRMILNDAYAGKMVQTFGDFVTGGNLVVGFIIFLLLTGINFVVITKGSGRVAEVAARFTLDALPGKQMSIDADLNTGVIDKKEALKNRKKVIAESDFYGAMDGASKFVRGDAIAGIVITFINVIGGFIVGMLIKGLPFHDVANIYLTLTVGDGLVTQIPALLISVAAGIIVTRSSSDENLGLLFRNQLLGNSKALFATAIILVILSLVPGMPSIILWILSGTLLLLARGQGQIIIGTEKKEHREQQSRLERSLEDFSIRIGMQLDQDWINLLSEQSRREMIQYLGIAIPYIDVFFDNALTGNQYSFTFKGTEINRQIIYPSLLLVIPKSFSPSNKSIGIPTIDPITQQEAFWIKKESKNRFSPSEYQIYESSEVFIKHLKNTLLKASEEMLTRREVLKLIEQARTISPEVVEEVYPHRLNLTSMTKILRSLLHEGVPLTRFVSIIDTLADNINTTLDVDTLVESVRQAMVRYLALPYVAPDKFLYAIVLDPKIDQMFTESLAANEKRITLHPQVFKNLIFQLFQYQEKGQKIGCQPILLTSVKLRRHIKNLIERRVPQMPVFSYQEISPQMTVKQLGLISADILAYTSSHQGVL